MDATMTRARFTDRITAKDVAKMPAEYRELLVRLLTIQASASGLPWIAVRAEGARWAVLVIGWLLPLPGGLLTVATVWALAASGRLSLSVAE